MKYIVALLALAVGAFAIVAILSIGGMNVWPFEETAPWQEHRPDRPWIQQPNPHTDYPVNRFYETVTPITFKGGGEIRITHRVNWDNKEKIYVYYYKLENMVDTTVLVSWEVLDIAFNHDDPLIHKLGPYKPLELTLKSEAAPVSRDGGVVLFVSNGETSYTVSPAPHISGPVPGVVATRQDEPEEEEPLEE